MSSRFVSLRIEFERRAKESAGVRRIAYTEAARAVEMMMSLPEKDEYRNDKPR